MENIYLKTKNKKECNGCTACAYVCPKKCITMKEDNEGFIYPVIDETNCVHCNKCLTVCSNTYKKDDKREKKPYAIVNNNKDILKKSTSGGIFYALIKDLFEKSNGVCYGAAWDNMEVKHLRAETLEEAMKFMGSKYVRSNIEGVYEMVKKDLLAGKNVLFSGTPCMTAGLYTYLKRDADNLLTVDIICHSNPSPMVFKRYIKSLELSKKQKVVKYTFRTKDKKWGDSIPLVEMENGEKIKENTYAKAFFSGLITRPSCGDCKFLEPWRVADITIGDFWGVDKLTDIKDYEDGMSLVYANTKKGEETLTEVKGITRYKLDENLDYLLYNHHSSVSMHRNREKFFNKLEKTKDEDVMNLLKKMAEDRLYKRIIMIIKKMLKKQKD